MDRILFTRLLRLLGTLLVIVIGGLILYFLSSLIYPFLIAFIIAFFIHPVVQFLEERARLNRSIATFFVLVILLSLIIGLFTFIIAEIIQGTTYLATVVPEHFQKLVLYLEAFMTKQLFPIYHSMAQMFQSLDINQQETILSNIQSFGEHVGSNTSAFLKDSLERIPMLLSWFPNTATVLIFSLLATFFISKDWNRWKRQISKILPARAKQSSFAVFAELQKAFFGFLKAQLTLISITTLIVLLGLIFLNVNYALTIAILIGLVDLLPYVGTGLIFVPWIIYLTFSGSLPTAIGIGVLYVIVLIFRQIIEPKILSYTIGIDPFFTLVSLFIGFKLFGFIGLMIGPVTLVLLKTLYTVGVLEEIWAFIKGK